jgi:Predicted signal-transduction protein containing cAMP-binding and CBS domains
LQKEAIMLVQDVMSTGVVSAGRADSVRSVVTKMLSRHCGAIPVVEDDDRLIGMVTVRDVLIPLYPNYGEYIHDNVHSRDFTEMEEGYAEVLNQKVGDVMSLNPLTVSPRTPVLEAASYMGLKNFRRIPVVDKGKLVGMVSVGDVNRGLFFERGHAAIEQSRAAQPSGR